jgi:hypothetical protein
MILTDTEEIARGVTLAPVQVGWFGRSTELMGFPRQGMKANANVEYQKLLCIIQKTPANYSNDTPMNVCKKPAQRLYPRTKHHEEDARQ